MTRFVGHIKSLRIFRDAPNNIVRDFTVLIKCYLDGDESPHPYPIWGSVRFETSDTEKLIDIDYDAVITSDVIKFQLFVVNEKYDDYWGAASALNNDPQTDSAFVERKVRTILQLVSASTTVVSLAQSGASSDPWREFSWELNMSLSVPANSLRDEEIALELFRSSSSKKQFGYTVGIKKEDLFPDVRIPSFSNSWRVHDDFDAFVNSPGSTVFSPPSPSLNELDENRRYCMRRWVNPDPDSVTDGVDSFGTPPENPLDGYPWPKGKYSTSDKYELSTFYSLNQGLYGYCAYSRNFKILGKTRKKYIIEAARALFEQGVIVGRSRVGIVEPGSDVGGRSFNTRAISRGSTVQTWDKGNQIDVESGIDGPEARSVSPLSELLFGSMAAVDFESAFIHEMEYELGLTWREDVCMLFELGGFGRRGAPQIEVASVVGEGSAEPATEKSMTSATYPKSECRYLLSKLTPADVVRKVNDYIEHGPSSWAAHVSLNRRNLPSSVAYTSSLNFADTHYYDITSHWIEPYDKTVPIFDKVNHSVLLVGGPFNGEPIPVITIDNDAHYLLTFAANDEKMTLLVSETDFPQLMPTIMFVEERTSL